MKSLSDLANLQGTRDLASGEIVAQFSIVKLSELEGFMRIDPDYYQPVYLEINRRLRSKKTTTFASETSCFRKGIFEIKADVYSAEGIPFVRISNLKSLFIDETDIVHIPEIENNKHKPTHLVRGDLILSKTANPAASYVNIPECNCSQDTIAVKLRGNSCISSEFLTVFLNSKYGLLQMQRWFTGNIQMHLNLIECKGLLIPVFEKNIQTEIKDRFEAALLGIANSAKLLNQAEAIVLDEVGFNSLILKSNLTYTKNFLLSNEYNRIDSEYYQPRYEKIVAQIDKYGSEKIEKAVKINNKKTVPKAKQKYKYIELADISKDGFVNSYSLELGENLPTRARRIVESGDVIISSIEGSLTACALIDDELDGALCSTGFYAIKSEKINPETLLTLFKSSMIRALMKKGCSGSILTAISQDEFEKIPLPIIGKEIQSKIALRVREAHQIRKKARNELKDLIKQVENRIEN